MEVEHAEPALPGTMDGRPLRIMPLSIGPRLGCSLPPPAPVRKTQFPQDSRFVAEPYQHSHVFRHIRELAAAA